MKGISPVSRPRRFLPSISLLSAFEAVLRTGSTAAAARDLDLSQGAISRLIQHLEQQIGQDLFVRERRRLIPTDAARSYGRDVTRALDLVTRATMEVASNPGGGSLSLAILPGFGTRWLAPRLAAFSAAHPGITVNVATRMKHFNFEAEGFDAALHFGHPDWRAAGHVRLAEEHLVACASGEFLSRHPLGRVEDLHDVPLLQIESRPRGWAGWFRARGHEGIRTRGMLFDQFAPMVEAAIHGMGVALVPDFMVGPEVADGRLRLLWPIEPAPPSEDDPAYWLVWPAARADHPPLVALRDWMAQAGAVTD